LGEVKNLAAPATKRKLGVKLARPGKRDQAHELLAPVYSWFTEGFGTRDLKEVKTLLVELAA
jgi:predicted ATPase